jgi:hypothetical protein
MLPALYRTEGQGKPRSKNHCAHQRRAPQQKSNAHRPQPPTPQTASGRGSESGNRKSEVGSRKSAVRAIDPGAFRSTVTGFGSIFKTVVRLHAIFRSPASDLRFPVSDQLRLAARRSKSLTPTDHSRRPPKRHLEGDRKPENGNRKSEIGGTSHRSRGFPVNGFGVGSIIETWGNNSCRL